MKMQKFKTICLGSLLSCLLLSSTVLGKESLTLAKEEVAKQSLQETGKITILLEDGKPGTKKHGIGITCVKVGDLVDGEYVSLYPDVDVNLNELETGEELRLAAKTLEERVKKEQKRGSTRNREGSQEKEKASGKDEKDHKEEAFWKKEETNEKGVATFINLPIGVYLIYGEDVKTYDTIEPTLLSIPTWSEEEKAMVYEVEVMPKHSPKPEPEKKKAPPTGLVNHTKAYLIGGGIFLVLGGIFFTFRKREKI